jgi:bifunctional non-homologous end joining protein LigD
MPVGWDELLEVSGAADWNVVTGIAEAKLKSSDKTDDAVQQEITDKMRRAVRASG